MLLDPTAKPEDLQCTLDTESQGSVMKTYKNAGASSTVSSYEFVRDAVVLEFADGTKAVYTPESAGPNNIERMKVLAETGKGLGTFLSGTIKVAPARTVA
jgi:hypothetical protein